MIRYHRSSLVGARWETWNLGGVGMRYFLQQLHAGQVTFLNSVSCFSGLRWQKEPVRLILSPGGLVSWGHVSFLRTVSAFFLQPSSLLTEKALSDPNCFEVAKIDLDLVLWHFFFFLAIRVDKGTWQKQVKALRETKKWQGATWKNRGGIKARYPRFAVKEKTTNRPLSCFWARRSHENS